MNLKTCLSPLSTGTFLSRAPLGFKAGPNMYTYVRQNPWTHFDPEGLDDNKPKPPQPPPKQTNQSSSQATNSPDKSAKRNITTIGLSIPTELVPGLHLALDLQLDTDKAQHQWNIGFKSGGALPSISATQSSGNLQENPTLSMSSSGKYGVASQSYDVTTGKVGSGSVGFSSSLGDQSLSFKVTVPINQKSANASGNTFAAPLYNNPAAVITGAQQDMGRVAHNEGKRLGAEGRKLHDLAHSFGSAFKNTTGPTKPGAYVDTMPPTPAPYRAGTSYRPGNLPFKNPGMHLRVPE